MEQPENKMGNNKKMIFFIQKQIFRRRLPIPAKKHSTKDHIKKARESEIIAHPANQALALPSIRG